MSHETDPVAEHYTIDHLFEKIISSLEQAGIGRSNLSYQDIAAADQFHVGGMDISRRLAQQAGLQQGWQVLDIGCGIGGPCRMLAAEFGCTVTGIDITPEYIRTATKLSALAGLSGKTTFVYGSALALPFPGKNFDAVWTQHVQMNIPDKTAFYNGISRVVKDGGLFIYHDIVSTGNQPVSYPTPWADDASQSFLFTGQDLQQQLHDNHFTEVFSMDYTKEGISFFEKMLNRTNTQIPKGPTLQLLMGDTFPLRMKNIYHNLLENKLAILSGICVKQRTT
jgi:ubiquinone/menaquinone biosynthesis C-methylase UbiE